MDKTFYTLEFNKILELLCEKAVSDKTKQKILLLKPYLNERELNIKMNETTQAKAIIENFGTPPLSSMKDIDKIVSLVEKNSMLIPEQLTNIAQFLISCKRIKKYLKKSENINVNIISYGNSINDLEDLYNEIETNIKNGIVDNAASNKLRDVRKKIETVNSQIKTKLDSLLRSKKEYFTDSYVTIRNSHYTLPVKKEYKHQINGTIIDSSQSGSTYFIEPSVVSGLKEKIQELQIEEDNEVRKILYTLTGFVESYLYVIKINIETMEALDFIFSKAKLSIDMNASDVKINVGRKIIIKSGIHPLLKKETAVPLDFSIGDTISGVVITGPNTGGKTVALKTVGLLSLMAQSGLHVPVAPGSEFCMNNIVLCDIGDGQSISENLSTFSSHMTNVIQILNTINEQSLVLLDELGSGTDPAEGMGIAIAVLEELKIKNCLFVVTTHYPEVKTFSEHTQGIINARMEFDRQSLKPLYTLKIGEAGESCALYIAQRLGFPNHMLNRAYSEAYKTKDFSFSNKKDTQIISTPIQTIQTDKKYYKPKSNSKFNMGDSVMIYPQKLIGIVYKEADEFGNLIVQIKGKKQFIKHTRVKLVTPSSELYPPDYDFSIIFDSVENRKAKRIIERKYSKDTEVKYSSYL